MCPRRAGATEGLLDVFDARGAKRVRRRSGSGVEVGVHGSEDGAAGEEGRCQASKRGRCCGILWRAFWLRRVDG